MHEKANGGATTVAEHEHRAAQGFSPMTERQIWAMRSMPLRKSIGSMATRIRACGAKVSMRLDQQSSDNVRRRTGQIRQYDVRTAGRVDLHAQSGRIA